MLLLNIQKLMGIYQKSETLLFHLFRRNKCLWELRSHKVLLMQKFMSTMRFADHENVPKFFLKKLTLVPSYSSCYFKSRPFSNYFFWLIKSIFKLLIQLSSEFFYFTLSILLDPCLICFGYLLLWVYII